jgi:hypothetical protein
LSNRLSSSKELQKVASKVGVYFLFKRNFYN